MGAEGDDGAGKVAPYGPSRAAQWVRDIERIDGVEGDGRDFDEEFVWGGMGSRNSGEDGGAGFCVEEKGLHRDRSVLHRGEESSVAPSMYLNFLEVL